MKNLLIDLSFNICLAMIDLTPLSRSQNDIIINVGVVGDIDLISM